MYPRAEAQHKQGPVAGIVRTQTFMEWIGGESPEELKSLRSLLNWGEALLTPQDIDRANLQPGCSCPGSPSWLPRPGRLDS